MQWTVPGQGCLVAQSLNIWLLISAQVMTSGSWDWAQHRAPCSVGLWLGFSLSISRYPSPPAPSQKKRNGPRWGFDFFLKILFIYSWDTERERERGRDTGRGRSRLRAVSQCGTQSRDSRIKLWAAGGAKPLSHLGCPGFWFLNRVFEIKSSFYKVSNWL